MKLFTLAFFIGTSLLPAFAEETTHYAAGMIGANFLAAPVSAKRFGGSLKAGTGLMQTQHGLLAIGAYLNTFMGTVSGTNFNVIFFGPELTYKKIAQTGMYVSGRLGLGVLGKNWKQTKTEDVVTTTLLTGSTSAIGLSPVIGYEHALNDNINLLAEGSWTRIFTGGERGLSTCALYVGAAYTW